jgi:hypothetical protein
LKAPLYKKDSQHLTMHGCHDFLRNFECYRNFLLLGVDHSPRQKPPDGSTELAEVCGPAGAINLCGRIWHLWLTKEQLIPHGMGHIFIQ